jgi:hypothetical protein
MDDLESWWTSLTGRRNPGAAYELRVLRLLTAAVVVALLVALGVLFALVDGTSYPMPWPAVWGLAAGGSLAGLGVVRRLRRNDLVGARDAETLRAVYRPRMIVGLAFGEVPALLGLVFSLQLDSLMPYLVALPCSLVAIGIAAPRAADIRSVQADRDAAGRSARLAEALTETTG